MMFTRKELHEFSLAKAIRLAAKDELRGCLEADMLEEAAVRAGRMPGVNTLTIPFELLAACQNRGLTVAGESGSKFVNTDVSAALDVLRPWSVTAKAGVRILPGLQGDTVVPRTLTTIAGEWLPTEEDEVTVSQPVIDGVTMRPKAAVALARYSRLMSLMVSSVPMLDAYLARDLSRAVAAMLDRAVLIGSGANGEPQGIANTDGILTPDGTSLSWSDIQDVIEDLADVDIDESTLAFIGSPSVRKILSQRERMTGSATPIWNDREIAGFPAHVTTGTAAGSMTVGAFDGIAVGIWGEALQLQTDPFTFFKTGVVQFRCWLSADIAVAPGSFAVIPSIT